MYLCYNYAHPAGVNEMAAANEVATALTTHNYQNMDIYVY